MTANALLAVRFFEVRESYRAVVREATSSDIESLVLPVKAPDEANAAKADWLVISSASPAFILSESKEDIFARAVSNWLVWKVRLCISCQWTH